MRKLKLQHFGHLIQRADSLGKIEGRRKGQEDEAVAWHHQLSGHEFEQTLGNSEEQEVWHAAVPWNFKESDISHSKQL